MTKSIKAGSEYRNRIRELEADEMIGCQRRDSVERNNNDNNLESSERSSSGTTSGSGSGVVFPDSFEVLPQTNPQSVVYMSVPHEQQRKFRCRFCGKGYRWKSTMRRHETVECGGKPPSFQCPECPYKARQRGNLTVHYKRHHQKSEPLDDNVQVKSPINWSVY